MQEQKIYGTRAIIEAIKADKQIDKVFLQKGVSNNTTRELEALLKKNKISTSYVPLEKLNKLSQKNHQGAVARITPILLKDFETTVNQVIEKEKKSLFLLLDQISDVRNFGAIIRTAECSGVDAIIIPKTGAAPINQDTIKTSAGAAFNIPICKVDHLKDAIYYLQSSGIKLIAATEKTDALLYDIELQESIALIMGSEDKGVTPAILKMVDHKAKLPMTGKISSLNVSVACGAFLYEIVRQRL